MSSFHGNFFTRSTDLLGLATVPMDTSYTVEVVIEEELIQPLAVMQVGMLYSSCYGAFLFYRYPPRLERVSSRGTKNQGHHTRFAHFVQSSGDIPRRGSSSNRALPLRQSRRTHHLFFGHPRSCTGRRDQDRHRYPRRVPNDHCWTWVRIRRTGCFREPEGPTCSRARADKEPCSTTERGYSERYEGLRDGPSYKPHAAVVSAVPVPQILFVARYAGRGERARLSLTVAL